MARKTGSKRGSHAKGKKRDEVERKRDERAQRNFVKKDKQAKEYRDGGDFSSFNSQLRLQGLCLKDVSGDGNCLFRAFADQITGDDKNHGKQRQDVIKYMKDNQSYFEPFLDETMTFDKYIQSLSNSGTYGGNDSIVAFARYNKVDVIIHQLNSPTFVVYGEVDGLSTERTKNIHLAYHNYEHYSSVRQLSDPGTGPAYLYHKEFSASAEIKHAKVAVHEQVILKHQRKKAEKAIANTTEQNNLFGNNNTASTYALTPPTDLETIVDQVKKSVNYNDENMIKKLLVEHDYNQDSVLSYLIQLIVLQDVTSPQLSDDDLNDKFILNGNETIFCECQIKSDKKHYSLLPCQGRDTKLVNSTSISHSGLNTASLVTTDKLNSKLISNRQRKEQAKKKKKKNREQAKKKEFFNKNENTEVTHATTTMKCIKI